MKTSKKILIIEDEKNLRDAIVDVLHVEKFESIEAKNGKEGLDLALSQHPDLILLDLLLPEMDGMTVLKNIREDETWGKKVPVIILTNLSATNENLVDAVVTHKPMYYLIKSDWKLHDVVEKIKEVLEI